MAAMFGGVHVYSDESERKVMNGKTFLLVLMAASLLSGCLRKEILDDINIESAVGFDYVSPTK